MSEDMEKLAQEQAEEEQPGDYDRQSSLMNNDVTGDNTTNGISASMVRFGDMDGNEYDEKMDQLSEEFKDKP